AGRGLDWLNLFVANIQTGFGPFVSVYLTTQGWTQTSIGLALSIGTVTAMASQVPAGALVDAARSKGRGGLLSILAFGVSALLFALWPVPGVVYLAEMLHGFSSCTLGPVVAAISLAITGPAALGLRLGRNLRFSSLGAGIGAVLMGISGYVLPTAAVFFVTAALTIPAVVALAPLAPGDIGPMARDLGLTRPSLPTDGSPASGVPLRRLLADRRLLVFGCCAALFTLANASMLPLAGSALTSVAAANASLLVGACIVLPQLIVAALSPTAGRLAPSHGRRVVLLLGLAPLPLRGLVFALTGDPGLIVLVQILDGVAAACFGVMVPLVTSDLAGRSGHFNLCLGVIGFAIGIGATASTALAGFLADQWGIPAAFAGLALIGLAATAFLWAAMPETRPPDLPGERSGAALLLPRADPTRARGPARPQPGGHIPGR